MSLLPPDSSIALGITGSASPKISMKELQAQADAASGAPIHSARGANGGAKPHASQTTKPATPKPKAKAKAKVSTLEMDRFGLSTEAQWLLTVPSRYEDYKTFTDDFRSLYQGTPALIRGVIVQKQMVDDRRRETTEPRYAVRLSADIRNARGQVITVQAFGRPGFAWRGYEAGSEIILRGTPKPNPYRGNEITIDGVEVVDPSDVGGIYPIYPAIRGAKGERFAERVRANSALHETAAQLVEAGTGWRDRSMGQTMSDISKFSNADELLRELHRPSSIQRGDEARRAAKILSAWALVRTTNKRVDSIEVNPRSIINIDRDQVEILKSRIPFPLTSDQRTAIDGICHSLRSPMPMNGLLIGDVGTGKTLPFVISMIAAFQAGKKAMLLTPNLLLIQQIEAELSTFFPEVPLCKVTSDGGVEGDSDSSVTFGSTALLSALKKGKLGRKPDFLVVDEQHKFSIQQREQLMDKHTNSLEASATPIPRTAALATHGAKDLFMLTQMPVRKTIASRRVGRAQALEARNMILGAIARGEQAAVIYPLIESDDPAMALKSVNEAAANWSRKVPVNQIAVLHGKTENKDEVLKAFRRGDQRLLLASSVIEVGVTLPELKVLMIIDAEKFGIVTLHQLRGRLARNGGHGEFIMFTESQTPDSLERLQLLVDHQDGFVLAEKDAELRGYGDILGLDGGSQSGKTRTLFLGVNVGPRDISFAVNLHERTAAAESASLAPDTANAIARPGDSLRIF